MWQPCSIYGKPVSVQILCTKSPDPPHFEEYSVCVYVYILNPSMCAGVEQLHSHNPGDLLHCKRFVRFSSSIREAY